MNGKCQILLSTYNGEAYVRELLDSILKQDYSNLEILIRDDGSKDTTIKILKEYEHKYSNIRVVYGDNVGVSGSFTILLNMMNKSCEYFAFADQDDIWKYNKISQAILYLDRNKADLYCGHAALVTKDLNEIHYDLYKDVDIRPSFGNAIIETISPGCTLLWNKKLMSLYMDNRKPTKMVIHDQWMYLLATAFCNVVYDSTPYILYRQHNNTIGSPISFKNRLIRVLSKLKIMRKSIDTQLNEFIKCYQLPCSEAELVKIILDKSLFGRIKVFFDSKIYRQKKVDTIIYKILLLIF